MCSSGRHACLACPRPGFDPRTKKKRPGKKKKVRKIPRRNTCSTVTVNTVQEDEE
jgi:hypothetical protein